MGAFGVGQGEAQWLSAGFLATMTVAMLLNAWMISAIGKRNTYFAAMAIFVGGSILGVVSPNFDSLVFSRILQGAGAGLIHPLALQVIYEIFPPEQRGRAMGFFGFGIVLAPALGPAFGGILVDAFDWRAVFYMVIPFCVIGALMAAVFMPPREVENKRPQMDWSGLILVSIFMFSLLSALLSFKPPSYFLDILSFFFISAETPIAGCGLLGLL